MDSYYLRLLAVSGSRPGPGTLNPDPDPGLQGRVPGSYFRPLFCHIFAFFAHDFEFLTIICQYLGRPLRYRNSKGTKICRKDRAFQWHGQKFNCIVFLGAILLYCVKFILKQRTGGTKALYRRYIVLYVTLPRQYYMLILNPGHI